MQSNLPERTQNCPLGLLPLSSQWFEEVRCCRTAPNSLLPSCFPLRHSPSRRFGVFEPPRTHSHLPCWLASPFIAVVRGGSVRSNRHERTQTFPVGLLPPTSQWFEEKLPEADDENKERHSAVCFVSKSVVLTLYFEPSSIPRRYSRRYFRRYSGRYFRES